MNTGMAVQRRGFLYSPAGIVLAIAGIVVLWGLMRGDPTTLVLLAVAVLFLLGFRRPLWAVAALLVSQFTVTSYMVGTPLGDISLRLLLLVLTLLIMVPAFVQKQVDLGPNARGFFIPMVLLIGISTIANLVNSSVDFAFTDFRNMIVGLLIVILLPAVINSRRDLKILCGVSLVVLAASAAVGLMQHYQFLGMDQATLLPGFLGDAGDRRVPGISETELELAYLLSTAFLVTLSIYVANGIASANRKILFLCLLLMASALYFTYTRSAVLGLGFGLIALVLFLKTRIKGAMVLGALLFVMILIETTGALGGLSLGGRSESSQEESSISRPILWQAGVAIALDNPILGIGGDRFSAVSPQYASAVDPSLLAQEEDRYWAYTTLGNEQVHNDFLRMWVSYGTLTLIAYVWLYLVILQNLLDSRRISKSRLVRGLSLGLAAAVVAYAVNAFYHNMMITLPLLWILGGFSLVARKLAARETRPVPFQSIIETRDGQRKT